MNEKFVREWFIRRFKRQPEDDKIYYEEWVGRFKGSRPISFMDSESKEVYDHMINEGWLP